MHYDERVLEELCALRRRLVADDRHAFDVVGMEEASRSWHVGKPKLELTRAGEEWLRDYERYTELFRANACGTAWEGRLERVICNRMGLPEPDEGDEQEAA